MNLIVITVLPDRNFCCAEIAYVERLTKYNSRVCKIYTEMYWPYNREGGGLKLQLHKVKLFYSPFRVILTVMSPYQARHSSYHHNIQCAISHHQGQAWAKKNQPTPWIDSQVCHIPGWSLLPVLLNRAQIRQFRIFEVICGCDLRTDFSRTFHKLSTKLAFSQTSF